MTRRIRFGVLGFAAIALAGSPQAAEGPGDFGKIYVAPPPIVLTQYYQGEGGVPLDVPYVPTPQPVVNRMLELAKAGPNDIHFDLGSGDGRIVVTAARDFKVKRSAGVDLDPQRIKEANANAAASNVTDRVSFTQGDLFQFDFKGADVLTLYLFPEINMKLRPIILDEMKPGTRVVSHAFTMGDWEADVHETVDGKHIYFWVVPAKVQGTWSWKGSDGAYRLELTQKYQTVTGMLHGPGGPAELTNVTLNGTELSFTAGAAAYKGKVSGDTLTAEVDAGGKKSTVKAARGS